MDDTDYSLVLRRLDETLMQARELAGTAKADMLVYLIEMARLELQVMQTGDAIFSRDDMLTMMRGK